MKDNYLQKIRETRNENPLWDINWISKSSNHTFNVLDKLFNSLKVKPNVVVVDKITYGGFMAAEKHSIPAILSNPQLLSGFFIITQHLTPLYLPTYDTM